MRPLFFVILLVLFSFLSCLYLPWWSIAVVAFLLTCLLPQKPGAAFTTAFAAIFVFWLVFSFIISLNNDHILAKRASLLIVNIENPWLFMLITAIIGGIVSGLGALTAAYLFAGKKRDEFVLAETEE